MDCFRALGWFGELELALRENEKLELSREASCIICYA